MTPTNTQQLTDNWAEKCVLLKKRFPRLTDGDLAFEPDDPGSEGRMMAKLSVKTGLNLDNLRQLIYNLLPDLLEIEETDETRLKVETGPEKEPEPVEELTEDEFNDKADELLSKYPQLDGQEIEYYPEQEGSFDVMLQHVEEILAVTKAELIQIIKNL